MRIEIEIDPSELTLTGVEWDEDYWRIQKVEFNGVELNYLQYDEEALQNYLDELHKPDHLNDPFNIAA